MHLGSFSILFLLLVLAATMSPTNVLADQICSPPQSPGRLLGFEILDDPADGHYKVVWAGSTTVYEDLCGTTRYTLSESADEGQSWVTVDQQLHIPLTTYSWQVPPEGRDIGTYQYRMLVCNSSTIEASELCALSHNILAQVSGTPAPPTAISIPWGVSVDGNYSVQVLGREEVGLEYRVYERTRPLGSTPVDWSAWVVIHEGVSNEVVREALESGLYDYSAQAGNEHGWSEMREYEGQKAVVRAPSVSVGYSYDALGRLSYVTDPIAGDRDYRYDPAGNRTSVATNGEDHNLPPTAVDDAATVEVGTTQMFDLVDNDTDPNNTNSELSVSFITQPSIASVALQPDGRTVAISATVDGVRVFQYGLVDGFGGEDTAFVSLTVTDPEPPAQPTNPRLERYGGCPPPNFGNDSDGRVTLWWDGDAPKFFARRFHAGTGEVQCSSVVDNNDFPYGDDVPLKNGGHDFKVRACQASAVLSQADADKEHCSSTPEKCSAWTSTVSAFVNKGCVGDN